MFREDIIPACRSHDHPSHTDRKRWMKVIKEDQDYVVWCCWRCSEIVGYAVVQVQVLPRGKERARWQNRLLEADKLKALSRTMAGGARISGGER